MAHALAYGAQAAPQLDASRIVAPVSNSEQGVHRPGDGEAKKDPAPRRHDEQPDRPDRRDALFPFQMRDAGFLLVAAIAVIARIVIRQGTGAGQTPCANVVEMLDI